LTWKGILIPMNLGFMCSEKIIFKPDSFD